eukprot:SAG22_NODE_963_length_6279_cov_30.717314_3_plen_105_part_00
MPQTSAAAVAAARPAEIEIDPDLFSGHGDYQLKRHAEYGAGGFKVPKKIEEVVHDRCGRPLVKGPFYYLSAGQTLSHTMPAAGTAAPTALSSRARVDFKRPLTD